MSAHEAQASIETSAIASTLRGLSPRERVAMSQSPEYLADDLVVSTYAGPCRIDPDASYGGWFEVDTGELCGTIFIIDPTEHRMWRYGPHGRRMLLGLTKVGQEPETPEIVRRRYGYGMEITGHGWDLPPTEDPGYRILHPGEQLQMDDELWLGQWAPADTCQVGRKIESYNVCCRRRVVTPGRAHAFPDSAKVPPPPAPVAAPSAPTTGAPKVYTHRLRICGHVTDVKVSPRFENDGKPFWQMGWTLADGSAAGRRYVGQLNPKDPYAVHRAVLESVNKDGACESRRATIARMATAAHFEEQERLAKILPGPGTHCEWGEP